MASSKQFPHPWGEVARRYRAYRRDLPRIASQIALNEFNANFRRQGYLDDSGQLVRWQPRQSDKDKGRAILVKTGRLRRAMRAAPTYEYARVVNDTPYAAIHNRGGRIRGQHRAYATNLRSGLAKLRRSGNPAQMPARPFMKTNAPLLRKIGGRILKDLGSRVFQTTT